MEGFSQRNTIVNWSIECRLLGHCARTSFQRRLIDRTMGIRRPHHHVQLTCDVKLDLQVQEEFLHIFNGEAFFIDKDSV